MPSNNITVANVVILGGTGELGAHVSSIFLSEYRQAFPSVHVTTRDPSSEKARELSKKGAEIFALSTPWDTVLEGADVVVNVLPTDVCLEISKDLCAAMVKCGVKVYFVSEFGTTSHKGNFEGYQHPEWVNKPLLLAEARALSQGTYRTLALTCGAFLQWVLKLGIDWEKRTTQCVGSAEPLFGMTAFDDIARAVARVALIALDPAAAASLPEDGRVRVGGQFASVLDIKAAVKRVKGVELDVHISDAQAVRGMLKAKYPPETMDIIYYASVLNGEGGADYSLDNMNELINPGESLWKWTTLDDELRAM